MTPKDKAIELVDKFIGSMIRLEDKDWLESAKQCALIAVDEIFEYAKYDYDFNESWWQEVKTEIEKL